MRQKTILAIETSCDETAIALVECRGTLKAPRFKVLKNIISSQILIHRPFGGVVPMLAKREHIKNLPRVFKKLRLTTNDLRHIDYIAVTSCGPSLEPALWTGINFAKELSEKLNKPLIGVNHMEGHLYSCWLPIVKRGIMNKESGIKGKKIVIHNSKFIIPKIQFPAIALTVSGGHTMLLYLTSITKWAKLGETLDDAAGEAFDKVARMLGFPYPGGPEIQKLAAKGNPNAIKFPRPMLGTSNPAKAKIRGANYDFSFSGLKTSVLYYIRDNPRAKKADIAASFQQAVIDVLTKKTIRAAQEFNAKSGLLCGGVSANRALRDNLRQTTNDLRLNFFVPDFEFNTDNAAMIAAAGYIALLQKNKKRIFLKRREI